MVLRSFFIEELRRPEHPALSPGVTCYVLFALIGGNRILQ